MGDNNGRRRADFVSQYLQMKAFQTCGLVDRVGVVLLQDQKQRVH